MNEISALLRVTPNPDLNPANPFFDIRHQIEERDLKQGAIFPHSGNKLTSARGTGEEWESVRTDVRGY